MSAESSSAPARRRWLADVASASAAATPVTLLGELGSGRTFLARAIHRDSAWGGGRFVQIACDKSADIRATTRSIRSTATLVLREIGRLGREEQAALARVLTQESFHRDDHGANARIRLLATTTTSLDTLVTKGRFRADLRDLLGAMTIVVPPLRDRREEIAPLADQFLRRFAIIHRKRIARVSSGAMALLVAHSWPGNVRELTDAMEHAVVSCEDETVAAQHLPLAITRNGNGMNSESLEEAVNAYERDLIQNALRSTRGSRSRAARLLKTTYRVLHYKTRKYGIDYRRFKA